MRIPFLRNTIVIASILFMLAFYIFSWLQIFNDPNQHHEADFIAFYTAGLAAKNYNYSTLYEINLQRDIENSVYGKKTDQVLLYNHLPYLVPVLAIIVDDNFLIAYQRWSLILLCIFLITTWYLTQSLYGHETPSTRILLGGGVIAFTPLFISLWQGQDTAFLFLGLGLWCVGMLKQNDWIAASGLALVTTRPHICMALILPLLFKHRHVFWKFVWLAICLGIYSLLLVGTKGLLGFLNLLKISAQGKWFGMNPQNMPNLTGLAYRTLHNLNHNTINILSWIIYGLGLAFIIILWFKSKSTHESLLGLTVLIAVVCVPHLHAHDLTILILPLLFAIHDQKTNTFPEKNLIFLPATSFLFLFGLLVNSFYFIVPYIVFIGLAWNLSIQYQKANT